jgi:hypothetical protein
MPSPLSLLRTTAAEEEVIILLIICRCAIPVEHGSCCALESNDDGRVILVCPDMAPEPITLPAKVIAPVERTANINPISLFLILNIGVCGHVR